MDGMTKITAHSNYLEGIINLIIIKKIREEQSLLEIQLTNFVRKSEIDRVGKIIILPDILLIISNYQK